MDYYFEKLNRPEFSETQPIRLSCGKVSWFGILAPIEHYFVERAWIMGDFFYGWRRKTGVVMLGLACLLVSGWVRSFSSSDCIQWNVVCFTENGLLYVARPLMPEPMTWKLPEWNVTNVVAAEEESALNSITWKWQLMGFGDGEVTILGTVIRLILFPCWSIVLPLTLLSAYLLVVKPRAKIAPTNST